MRDYIPLSSSERERMLEYIGINSVDELFAVPDDAKLGRRLNLPEALSELELDRTIRAFASDAAQLPLFMGAGAYRHFIPSAVSAMASQAEFVTAYTPYQPEMSQGVLQAIFEYQTMIANLTGMDASNASVYDGATACAEAMAMCANATGRNTILISDGLDPQTAAVVKTYARFSGREVISAPLTKAGTTDLSVIAEHAGVLAGVIIQSPNYFGIIEDITAAADAAHAAKALLTVSVNPISLGILKSPGACGADIAVGDAQGLGNPLSFGGPYVGFMAATQKHMRRLPGRIVGQTVDGEGKRAFVLTLQAREQHIRREKASSNICSNQALCALTAACYLSYMGPRGLKEVAEQNVQKAHYAFEKITALPGMRAKYSAPFFNEFLIESGADAQMVQNKLYEKGIIGGVVNKEDNTTLYCVTEMNTRQEIDDLVDALREVAV